MAPLILVFIFLYCSIESVLFSAHLPLQLLHVEQLVSIVSKAAVISNPDIFISTSSFSVFAANHLWVQTTSAMRHASVWTVIWISRKFTLLQDFQNVLVRQSCHFKHYMIAFCIAYAFYFLFYSLSLSFICLFLMVCSILLRSISRLSLLLLSFMFCILTLISFCLFDS